MRTKNRALPKLEIPIGQVLSCSRERLTETPKRKSSSRDIVVTEVAPNRSVEVSGRIVRLEKDRMLFEFKGKERSIRMEKIRAFFPAKAVEEHRDLFFLGRFSNTISVPLTIESVREGQFNLRTLWGTQIQIPNDHNVTFSARNGRVEFLSNLEPVEVIEIPFFDRSMTWQKDQALDGRPLVLNSISYSKGLATHSHCELFYALNNAFSRLMVTVGISDQKRALGDVEIAIFADTQEIYRLDSLNETNSPIELDLPLENANRLRLVTQFGKGQDVGDEVIWANARLLRK